MSGWYAETRSYAQAKHGVDAAEVNAADAKPGDAADAKAGDAAGAKPGDDAGANADADIKIICEKFKFAMVEDPKHFLGMNVVVKLAQMLTDPYQ